MSIRRLFIASAVVLGLMSSHTAHAQSTPKPKPTVAAVASPSVPAALGKLATMSEWCKLGPSIPEGQGSFVALSAFKPEAGVKKTVYLVPDTVAPMLAYSDPAEVDTWVKANVSDDIPPFDIEPTGSVDDYLASTMLIPSGGYTVVWDSMLIGWLAAVPNTKDSPVKYLSMAYVEDDGMDTFVCVRVDANGKPAKLDSSSTGASTPVTSTLTTGVPPAGGIFDGDLSYNGKKVGPLMRATVSFSQAPLGVKLGFLALVLFCIVASMFLWNMMWKPAVATVATKRGTR